MIFPQKWQFPRFFNKNGNFREIRRFSAITEISTPWKFLYQSHFESEILQYYPMVMVLAFIPEMSFEFSVIFFQISSRHSCHNLCSDLSFASYPNVLKCVISKTAIELVSSWWFLGNKTWSCSYHVWSDSFLLHPGFIWHSPGQLMHIALPGTAPSEWLYYDWTGQVGGSDRGFSSAIDEDSSSL